MSAFAHLGGDVADSISTITNVLGSSHSIGPEGA